MPRISRLVGSEQRVPPEVVRTARRHQADMYAGRYADAARSPVEGQRRARTSPQLSAANARVRSQEAP